VFFKPQDKQLFYLANDQLWSYRWSHGSLSVGRTYGAGKSDLAAFGAALADREEQPAWLVADLIEEDYQRDTLPHVAGKSGRALRARKLNQLYRDTPYRYAAVQSRDPDGRRDDHVLFHALTNPAALQPWVQALEQHRIPLAGIVSLTALSAAVLKPLGLADEHLLLVTAQSAGLRQSYFHDGHLKFSRLTPSIDRDGVAVNIVAETEKTQQFLTSTRLVARGELLVACVLTSEAQLAPLQALCTDSAELAWRFVTLGEAARSLGIEHSLEYSLESGAGADGGLAEPLLLALLARQGDSAAGSYPLGDAGRFYQLWSVRRGLRAASAAVAAVAVLWLGVNLVGAWSAIDGRAELRAETVKLQARYHTLKAALPVSAERPENMKAAAQIDAMVAAHGPMPAPLLAIVSRALDGVPEIALTALTWQAGPADDASGTAAVTAGGAGLSSALIGVPAAPPQTLRIEAEVALPQSDYRAVQDSVTRFAQDLARTPHLQVALAQPPLDLRPTMKLSGKAASEANTGADAADANNRDATAAARAKFVLQLVWNP
jgi:hypothetical protein